MNMMWVPACALDTNVPGVKRRGGISCLQFDPEQEVLWAGSTSGVVSALAHDSYENILRYHASEDPIVGIFLSRSIITTVSKGGLATHSRGGMLQERWTAEGMDGITCCINPVPKTSTIVLGGEGKELVSVDAFSTKVVTRHAVVPHTTVMERGNRVLCCGKANGQIEIVDCSTLKPISKAVTAHGGRVKDISIKGNLVVTCGELPGLRNGKPILDIFVRVFDIRTMRQLRPISAKSVTQVCFLKRFTSSVLAVGLRGALSLCDVSDGTSGFGHMQIQTNSHLSVCASSATGEILAFGDDDGILTTMINREGACVNHFPKPPPPLPPPPDYVPLLGTDLPLCANGPMPPQEERRGAPLSQWRDRVGEISLYPMAPVDQSLVPEYRVRGGLGTAPYPEWFRANCLSSINKFTATSSSSDKFRRSAASNRSFMSRSRSAAVAIPKEYARVKIKIPRFGLHTFDFSSYNRSVHSGLLNLLPNSYVVEFIQVLYHLPPVREHILNHLCMKELCLTCELSFLFHMMNHSKGVTAEPRNFLRILRQIKEAGALGLLEGTESSRDTLLSLRIQAFCRFLLQHLSKENSQTGHKDVIREAFEFKYQRTRECLGGKHSDIDIEPGMTVKMEYPRVRRKATFEELLEQGLNAEKTQRVWCERCMTYCMMKKKKSMIQCPNILIVNANINSEADLDLWRTRDQQSSTPNTAKSTTKKTHPSNNTNPLRSSDATSNKSPTGSPGEGGEAPGGGGDAKDAATSPSTSSATSPEVPATWVASHLKLRFDTEKSWCHAERGVPSDFPPLDLVKSQGTPSEEDSTPPSRPAPTPHAPDVTDGKRPETPKKSSPRKGGMRTRGSPKWRIKEQKATKPPSGADASAASAAEKNKRDGAEKNNHKAKGTPPAEEQGNTDGKEGGEEDVKQKESKHQCAHFELVAVVSHVSDPPDTDSELNVYNAEHLTAHVRIEGEDGKKKWFLFNGFVITDSSLEDALEFKDFPWKQPCILVYQRHDIQQRVTIPERTAPILAHGLHAFLRPESLSIRSTIRVRTFAPLRPHERVGPEMRVAIDCEFVAVEKEETRTNRRTGKKIVVKPMRHSLARVSLVRASGPEAGRPLLDDYIVGSEQVVDYLTRYSGIEPGDLDRSISTRHLVTLKSAYVRLRYLADQGVIFIGHGLKSDFMLINIVVPKSQIVDTVDLYHLPGRRKLSLRFLAAHVLKLDIQGVTHDSIEDARTAMALYYRYERLKAQGYFEKALAQLYEIGDRVGFKA